MIYSISLIFEKETNNQIYNLCGKINSNLNLEFEMKETSVPHLTIIKFESKTKLTTAQLKSLIPTINYNIPIDLAGITVLPSKSNGHWIELSILKNHQLIQIQNEILYIIL